LQCKPKIQIHFLPMMKIHIEHKIFTSEGDKTLHINEEIAEGNFIAVSGNSGIGKTTLFKIIAGLIQPDFGFIRSDDNILLDTENKIFLPPQNRDIAFMFQNYALFPNMTVKQNITYAQKGKNELEIEELLEKFDLKNHENIHPNKLSGGQQQRVALARTLIQKAGIVLLDEPLSAVEDSMKKVMTDEILNVHKLTQSTFFVISHQQSDFGENCNKRLMIR
ncbi:MAG: ATP-binding cassette domain-containing protein, partial [Moheibacter sp.]